MTPCDATDSELVAASRRGDRAAFGELVERCGRIVSAVCYAATRDRVLGEEITQDTFVTAWRDLGRLRDPAAVRPWLCRIARNLAHKARRRRARELPHADTDTGVAGGTPYDAMRAREVEHVVSTALAAVPDLYREAIVLFYYEQQSVKDVAAALGVTEEVVHKRLSRGRRHLVAGLEKLVEDELDRRRTRRDLAACVLAALPVALAITPSPAEAAAKGTKMWKLGALGLTTTAVAVTAIAAWPRSDATAGGVPHLSARARPAAWRAPAAPPQLPPHDASPCGAITRHILDVALEGFEPIAEAHPARVQRVTEQLVRRCRTESWSQAELACMRAADRLVELAKCRPAAPEPPIEGPPSPITEAIDVTCPAIGAHVADLMIASLTVANLGNVTAAVTEDTDALPGQVVDACGRDAWSEPLRRCYAAAGRYGEIVACNRR